MIFGHISSTLLLKYKRQADPLIGESSSPIADENTRGASNALPCWKKGTRGGQVKIEGRKENGVYEKETGVSRP